MRDTDQEAWNTFVQSVTPLDQPKPSQDTPVLERILPSHRLDLHGYTLKEAHGATMALLEDTTDRLTIVTGLSGVIKREFPQWFDHRTDVRLEELRNGGGYVIHRRRKHRL